MLAAEHPECLHSHSLRSTHTASQRYLTADVSQTNMSLLRHHLYEHRAGRIVFPSLHFCLDWLRNCILAFHSYEIKRSIQTKMVFQDLHSCRNHFWTIYRIHNDSMASASPVAVCSSVYWSHYLVEYQNDAVLRFLRKDDCLPEHFQAIQVLSEMRNRV